MAASDTGASLADTRMIEKPGKFAVKHEKWIDWRFGMENYLACVAPEFQPELDAAAGAAEAVLDLNEFDLGGRQVASLNTEFAHACIHFVDQFDRAL